MNLKDEYIKFMEQNGHKQIPSAPIVPKDDPTVLFNTAGMQPLVPYLLGKTHPYGKRLCDYQKCVRLTDLEEIGDKTHHTFFEMLGNWSLGDYFKNESIKFSFDFLTKVLNIPVSRLAITVFEGDDKIPRDEVSAKRWEELGISKNRIAYLGRDDNFWIAGETGPCGGDTEIFYWRSDDEIPKGFDTNDERWVEIWNNVFMEFYQDEDGNITELSQKNVDTGMGVERVVALLEGYDDNYKSSIWKDVILKIEEITSLPYEGNEKAMRVVADHIRTATFIAADDAGIKPSNNGQGYILRRLIRRAIRYARNLNIDINSDFDKQIALIIIDKYGNYYDELSRNKDIVLDVLEKEKIKFNRTLEKGLREFDKLTKNNQNEINKDIAFKLYDTYGFPIEQTIEEANERGMTVDYEGFKEKFKEHQAKSKAGSIGKFKGGLAGTSEMEVKYHTATHLLNAALKIVLNSKDSHQMGSNITPERMRFDFTCDHKLSKEEIKEAEDIVNKWIKEDLTVVRKEMTKDEALKSGAECRFIERYPDEVTVYEIGDVSKELCGGPHVKHTNVLGHFKIVKEEASSAGVRRIKAVLED